MAAIACKRLAASCRSGAWRGTPRSQHDGYCIANGTHMPSLVRVRLSETLQYLAHLHKRAQARMQRSWSSAVPTLMEFVTFVSSTPSLSASSNAFTFRFPQVPQQWMCQVTSAGACTGFSGSSSATTSSGSNSSSLTSWSSKFKVAWNLAPHFRALMCSFMPLLQA